MMTLYKKQTLGQKNQKFKILNNTKKGLGGAINFGINNSTGEFLVIMMADQSDDIEDLKYYHLIKSENLDAVLGLIHET